MNIDELIAQVMERTPMHVPDPPITVLDGRPVDGMVISGKVYSLQRDFVFGELIGIDGYELNLNGFRASVVTGGLARVRIRMNAVMNPSAAELLILGNFVSTDIGKP